MTSARDRDPEPRIAAVKPAAIDSTETNTTTTPQTPSVVILGIHTPETSAEREVAAVRQKAAQEKFAFPICIDSKNENWNAWGNATWPSVYLVDKRGYVRAFWPGELRWQGATGDELLAKKIDALLAE